MHDHEKLLELFESLTGQKAPLAEEFREVAPVFPEGGLGYSQLNELLLLLGYDRVSEEYFQFLVDGTIERLPGAGLSSFNALQIGIDRSRQLSLLMFGNVKFGFKRLARNVEELARFYVLTQPLNPEVFRRRHEAIHPVDSIRADETYYLGYVVQKEIDESLAKDAQNQAALAGKATLAKVREKGMRNHRAYLVSDHIDVYIATSMRRRHEYLEVAQFAGDLFKREPIKDLKLRWFDPTQAFCSDRVDKGLAEALMLKRASCTLYLAQESDTFGKDSELASTLAQGKPVIAYVPSPTEKEIRESVSSLANLYARSEVSIVLERLQAISPGLAWADSTVRRWIETPNEVDLRAGVALLVKATRDHYDRRAETLKSDHPLGIQVNLDTGVANGVLVVRSLQECADLIFRIVTGTLQFRIEKKSLNGIDYHFLRETISSSIFRVMTGDAMLTNSFWNYYLGAA